MRTQQQLPVYFFVKTYLLATRLSKPSIHDVLRIFLGLSMGFVIKLAAC